MTSIDPKLVLNPIGYYAPSATSPAIDAASASYPSILDIASIDDDPTLILDISGIPRPASVILKDVGCSEYSTGTTTNHPLKLSEVGPAYLVSIPTKIEDNRYNQLGFQIAPNPASDRITINYELNSQSNVSLSIYNLSGMAVKNIIDNKSQSAGIQQQMVDISDLKSGIYLINFKSNNKTKTLKLLITK